MASPANVLAVLRFLWENADQLSTLLQKLPPALRAAGDGLETAGDGALLAADALGGADDRAPSAADALKQATEAMRQVQQQVQAIAREVRDAADALDQVRVPVVTPVKQRFNLKVVGLGEPELITGLNIGEQSPGFMAGITGRIRSQAGVLESGLAAQLGATAERLERMSTNLDRAGENMRSLGDSLKTGGGALKQFGA